MNLINQYIDYIKVVRRYSSRTVKVYGDILNDFARTCDADDDSTLVGALNLSQIRSYQVELLDHRKMAPKTVNLHLSVLSSFCRYLIKGNYLQSNPVALLSRPKLGKRLPEFFRQEMMAVFSPTVSTSNPAGIKVSTGIYFTSPLKNIAFT